MLLMVGVLKSWSDNLHIYRRTHDRSGTKRETMLLKFIHNFKLHTENKQINLHVYAHTYNIKIPIIKKQNQKLQIRVRKWSK